MDHLYSIYNLENIMKRSLLGNELVPLLIDSRFYDISRVNIQEKQTYLIASFKKFAVNDFYFVELTCTSS